MTVVLTSHYLPCTAYFALLARAGEAFIEAQEHFQKQTYRNRAYILTANGVERLTVPVQEANSKVPIQEVAINYLENWPQKHWRAIQSAYTHAPYFEHYAPYLHDLIYSREPSLFQLNMKATQLIAKLLRINTPIKATESFEKSYDAPIADFREVLHPKKEIEFSIQPYQQVFADRIPHFEGNLSILDLLFCEGPQAYSRLQRSGDVRPLSS